MTKADDVNTKTATVNDTIATIAKDTKTVGDPYTPDQKAVNAVTASADPTAFIAGNASADQAAKDACTAAGQAAKGQCREGVRHGRCSSH